MRQTWTLTGQQIDDFARNGVVCIRGAFADWVPALREAVDEVMARPRPSARDHAAGKAGKFFHDADLWRDTDEVRELVFHSPAVDIARQLFGASRLQVYGDHLLVKEPASPTAVTPWHQDEPYLRAAGAQLASIWIALDPVTIDTGAMRFVLGSHRWGKLFRPVRFATGEGFAADRFDETVPDIDGHPEQYPVVSYDLAPGDCTVHHIRTLHYAGGNRSADTRRRAVVLRYAGESVRMTDANPEALRAASGGQSGAELDRTEFPVVWEAETANAAG